MLYNNRLKQAGSGFRLQKRGASVRQSPAGAAASDRGGREVKIISRSEADTERAGEMLAGSLPGGSVVALYGGLCAGKTAFVRGMVRGMGIPARVSSPTFTIVNEYSDGGRELLHFDMYRLGGAQ